MTEDAAQIDPADITARLGYSPESFAEAVSVGRTLVFDEIKAGRLIARKAGRRTIIAYDDAVAWVRSLPKIEPAVRLIFNPARQTP